MSDERTADARGSGLACIIWSGLPISKIMSIYQLIQRLLGLLDGCWRIFHEISLNKKKHYLKKENACHSFILTDFDLLLPNYSFSCCQSWNINGNERYIYIIYFWNIYECFNTNIWNAFEQSERKRKRQPQYGFIVWNRTEHIPLASICLMTCIFTRSWIELHRSTIFKINQ